MSKFKEKLGGVLVSAMMLLFAIIGISAIAVLGQYYIEASKNHYEYQNIVEEFHSNEVSPTTTETTNTTDVGLDPDYLAWLKDKYNDMHDKNDDYAFWLKINGTDQEYPVCFDPGNNYYLHHNFNKNYSSNGCLFLSGNCTKDSDNFIIYGHNMRSGEMFGKLDKYTDENFAKDNRLIEVYLEDDHRFYEIVSVFTTDINNSPVDWERFVNFNTYSIGVSYGIAVKNASMFDFSYDPTICADRYLTLVTCEYTHSNGRLVIVARELGRPTIEEIKLEEN